MNRTVRICIEILGPPLVAAILIIACVTLFEPSMHPRWYGVYVAYSYFFALIPSFLYAVAMEVSFARGIPPSSWRMVGRSTLLGVGAGLLIGSLAFSDLAARWPLLVAMPALGATVGFLVGLVLRLLPQSNPKNA